MGGNRKGPGAFPVMIVFLVTFCLAASAVWAADTNSATTDGDPAWSQHVVQSYQQLQDQQRSMISQNIADLEYHRKLIELAAAPGSSFVGGPA